MLKRSGCAAALILLLGASLPCAAQNVSPPNAPPGNAASQTRDQRACAQGQAGSAAPSTSGSGAETLSDKLAQTDGVICPPNVDPDIRAPTPPQGGAMPVIPPPGSPGGDPTVRPK
jgi:hypothetical protein